MRVIIPRYPVISYYRDYRRDSVRRELPRLDVERPMIRSVHLRRGKFTRTDRLIFFGTRAGQIRWVSYAGGPRTSPPIPYRRFFERKVPA